MLDGFNQYGKFREAENGTVVKLGYKGQVLQSIVEYIHTDSAEILKETFVDEAVQAKETTWNERAKTIIELGIAAEYFHLSRLSEKVQKLSQRIIRQQPPYACTFLSECRIFGPVHLTCQKIEEFAWDVIRINPHALEGNAFLSLNLSILEEIVRDDKTIADELFIFQVIQSWSGGVGVGGGSCCCNNKNNHEEGDRVAQAKQLMKYIRLERIEPANLTSIVRPSGLVSAEQLLNAYEAQATEAHQRHGLSYKKSRVSDEVLRQNSGINVSGAGSSEINGLYMPDGHYGGMRKYTMNGRKNDNEPCIYTLCQGLDDDDTLCWYLSILDTTDVPSGIQYPHSDIDIYKAIVTDDCFDYPPSDSWECVAGLSPPPKLEPKI